MCFAFQTFYKHSWLTRTVFLKWCNAEEPLHQRLHTLFAQLTGSSGCINSGPVAGLFYFPSRKGMEESTWKTGQQNAKFHMEFFLSHFSISRSGQESPAQDFPCKVSLGAILPGWSASTLPSVAPREHRIIPPHLCWACDATTAS